MGALLGWGLADRLPGSELYVIHRLVKDHLFLAGDYEAADEIVRFGVEYLLRWGR